MLRKAPCTDVAIRVAGYIYFSNSAVYLLRCVEGKSSTRGSSHCRNAVTVNDTNVSETGA